MAHRIFVLFLFVFCIFPYQFARAHVNDVNFVSNQSCCVRHKKLRHFGYDINGSDYYIDVGQCKHYCSPHDEFSDPIHSCDHGFSCHPSTLRMETHQTFAGAKEIETVTSCACYAKPDNCERQSQLIRHFADSPYEVDVDIGVCRGGCSGVGDRCRTVRNRTESVIGPNGAVCVEVIEECGCRPSCYRMHRTSVYFDGSWNVTDANATGERNQITKEIDVGVCVGVCVDRGVLCVLRDTSDSSKCLMSLTEKPSSCIPSSYTTHRLETGRIVLAVKDCGC